MRTIFTLALCSLFISIQSAQAEEQKEIEGVKTTQQEGSLFISAGDKVYLAQTEDLSNRRLALLREYLKKTGNQQLSFSDSNAQH